MLLVMYQSRITTTQTSLFSNSIPISIPSPIRVGEWSPKIEIGWTFSKHVFCIWLSGLYNVIDWAFSACVGTSMTYSSPSLSLAPKRSLRRTSSRPSSLSSPTSSSDMKGSLFWDWSSSILWLILYWCECEDWVRYTSASFRRRTYNSSC